MLMGETEIASLLKARCPERIEDLGVVGLWLSIVVAFSVRLYPTDTEARIAWAATCGWHVERVRGPTPIGEVLLRTLKDGGPV
jgi:hypothetical protein